MARDSISAVAALDEPSRRRLYDYVVRARRPVGRDEASTALGITRPTAAFHLDRLVAAGLLEVRHARLSGRSGPGAGRPAKLYLRAERPVGVSLPERRYDLAGDLLAAAVEAAETTGEPVRSALAARAREEGRRIGESAPEADPVAALDACGFEPHLEATVEGEVVSLGNCPFHDLAQRHTQLVCGMNLELVRGLLAALGTDAWAAEVQPGEGRCCVVLAPA